MTLKELIAKNTSSLKPTCGDPAYTFYRGQKYAGKLMCLYNDDNQAIPFRISWDHRMADQPYKENSIDVGSDDPTICFDHDNMAWRVVANFD